MRRSDRVRIEVSGFARISVGGTVAIVAGAVATLLVIRHWVHFWAALVVTVVLVVIGIAILGSPESLVISRDEVRDESGWRRRGWTIRREDVAVVRWDDNPDIFEPPCLTFLDADDRVLRSVTLAFAPPRVLGALRRFDWPLEA